MSPSSTLRQKIALANAPVHATYARFWAHPELAELYPELQQRTHGIARASVPLMQAALARSEDLAPRDPVAAGLLDYLREHIEEERDHDEWLLEDLAALGVTREEVLGRTPPPSVACLVGAQYYWIHHGHPVALLGYMAALEGSPPSVDFAEGLAERTGLPRAGFRTFLEHARLDPHHAADLDALVDALPLSGAQLATIGVSAFQTVSLLARVTEEVVDAREAKARWQSSEAINSR